MRRASRLQLRLGYREQSHLAARSRTGPDLSAHPLPSSTGPCPGANPRGGLNVFDQALGLGCRRRPLSGTRPWHQNARSRHARSCVVTLVLTASTGGRVERAARGVKLSVAPEYSAPGDLEASAEVSARLRLRSFGGFGGVHALCRGASARGRRRCFCGVRCQLRSTADRARRQHHGLSRGRGSSVTRQAKG